MKDFTRQALIVSGASILRQYVRDHRTHHLEDLAPVIVELRARHRLADGRVDWSGRSPEYRQAIAELYEGAGLPEADRDTVQTALRYHVGNRLRDRAPSEELEAVGLSVVSPAQRLRERRAEEAAVEHEQLALAILEWAKGDEELGWPGDPVLQDRGNCDDLAAFLLDRREIRTDVRVVWH